MLYIITCQKKILIDQPPDTLPAGGLRPVLVEHYLGPAEDTAKRFSWHVLSCREREGSQRRFWIEPYTYTSFADAAEEIVRISRPNAVLPDDGVQELTICPITSRCN